MSSSQSVVSASATGPGQPPDAEQPRPWILTGLAGLGVVLVIQSTFGNWFTLQLTVSGVHDSYAEHGVGYLGLPGIGYVIGNLVLAGLVGVALWRTGRWRAWTSSAALAVCVLLMAELVVVWPRLTALEATAAMEIVRLRASADGLPASAGFTARSDGLYVGLAATLLFALVAVQLLTSRNIRIQAVAGLAVCAVAAATPWLRVWVLEDRRSGVEVESRAYWLWTEGYDGPVLLLVLAALLGVVYRCLRAPGYARSPWAIGAALLGALIVLITQIIETENQVRAYDLRAKVSELLDSTSTGAAGLMAVGAVLLVAAAVRAWWHGREEVAAPDPGDSWLPERLRDRLS